MQLIYLITIIWRNKFRNALSRLTN